MELNMLRKKIDQIDQRLLELLEERFSISKKIHDYKKKNNLPIQDKEREKQVIKERTGRFKELGCDDGQFVQELFELIMKKAREVQK